MRDREPGLLDQLVAVEEKVEIERSRAVLPGDADAAEALLDSEQPIEELARGQRGLEGDDAVEIRRLLPHSDRRRLAQGRDGDDLGSRFVSERADGCAQRALAVAEVGAQADEGARHGLVTVA